MSDEEQPQTQIIGPFDRFKVSVHGYEVPRVEIKPLKESNDGLSNLILDERFAVCATTEECAKWAPLIAHALAIGAGFTCHGENSKRANPFKTKIMGIGTVESGDGQSQE